ncbi:hypothetical protein SteCoe_1683 [Stentor coeruleus]|uniref:Translin-associated factor X-interacting protein 1 N-terminal domain-containing protein n=1 Tax=Stentor coeruleus TaxID=5963 RepID=A0A1R2D169_9CILI|nr:hypothetical protein SteCoe_1683 [Stentor coeruleus]
MSRIRKLSDGNSDLSLRRIKHRITSTKINPVTNMKIAKLSSSPYTKANKISRTPSYILMQPANSYGMTKSNSNSSVRTRSKESKNSLGQEDSLFLAQINNNPWESVKLQAKILKNRIEQMEKAEEGDSIYEKMIEFFSDVIDKDILFGSILRKIRSSYDITISKLNSEIARLKNYLETQTSEKQSYIRMLERISKENIELGNEVQRLESICSDLQNALDEIRNVKIDEMPKGVTEWKALVYENSQYSALVQNMKLDIKDYQFKEDQLIKLIDALKARGYPVDTVYEEEFQSKSDCDSDTSKSLSISQYKKIPTLELSKVVVSSDSLQL